MTQKPWIVPAVVGLAAAIGVGTYLLTPAPFAVAQLYVAPTGKDASDCRSIASPCARISYALDDQRCNPGDTVNVRAGVYNSDPTNIGQGTGDVFSYYPTNSSFCQGTASAPVTIKAYEPTPGVFEAVTIRSINYDPTITYHTWQRIKIDVSGAARKYGYNCFRAAAGTHHIRLLDMECTNSLASGGIATIGTTSFIEISGTCTPQGVCTCKAHHNGDDPRLDHGMYISSDDTLVSGCQLYDNAAMGVQFWTEGGVVNSRNTLRNSFIHGNGLAGVAVGGAEDALIANNVVHDNPDGIISLNGQRHRIVNNTVTRNARYGVEVQTGANTHRVENNILWAQPEDQRYLVTLAAATANLCLGRGTSTSPTCKIQNQDPRFVSTTDYALQATSPAIGAGADLGAPLASDALGTARPFPTAGAWDLGALEFTTAVPPPTPEPPPAEDLVRLLCETLQHPELTSGTWLLCHETQAPAR